MTAQTIRPLTAAERRQQELDWQWRRLTAELEELLWCPHLFRYRSDCRRCEVNAEIDTTENELAELNGYGAPNVKPRMWQGEYHR